MADGSRPDLAVVPVLFTQADTIYKSLPATDCYDLERDARTWSGSTPILAHPPCRSWSRMRSFAKPAPGERDLAPYAVYLVRRFGGVLEHPAGSSLWPTMSLPHPGTAVRDQFGGWSLAVDQFWFGHRARKRTFLYIVGIHPGCLPAYPLALGEAPAVCGMWSGRDRSRVSRPDLTKREREATPAAFAIWLVDVARRVSHA